MPRTPGRKPTRKAYPVSDLLVGYYLFPSDPGVRKKPCVVADCDHIIGNYAVLREPRSCEVEGNAARVVLASDILAPVGLACPCCVARITGD